MNRSELKRTPLQEKVDFVKDLARQTLQVENNDWYLCKVLTKLAHANDSYLKKYGAKKLTTDELLFLQVLRENGLKPHTVYTWFLLMRCPPEIRAKVVAGEISQREAMSASINQKELPNRQLEMEIVQEIRHVMEGI
jgi:hypothetical protein